MTRAVRATGLTLALVGGQPALAQEYRFGVTANVDTLYDSNVLRLSDARAAGVNRDDIIFRPNLGIDISRPFGRNQIGLTGTVGYDFHKDNTRLDRERINLTADSTVRFGARCQIEPRATLNIRQTDLEDLGVVRRSRTTYKSVSARVACPRSAGFTPTLQGSYSDSSSSNLLRRRNDVAILTGRAGLLYARPSLGEIEFYVARSEFNREDRADMVGTPFDPDTAVTQAGLVFSRSVSPRLRGSAAVTYANADPKSPAVTGFSGLNYGINAAWDPTSRLSLTGEFSRLLTANSSIDASYILQEVYRVRATYRLTAKTRLQAGASRRNRSFRGVVAIIPGQPRRDDQADEIDASVNYAATRRLSVNLVGRYRVNDTNNDFFDYSTSQLGLGVSLRL